MDPKKKPRRARGPKPANDSPSRHPLLILPFPEIGPPLEAAPSPQRRMMQQMLPIFGPDFPPPHSPDFRRAVRPSRYRKRAA